MDPSVRSAVPQKDSMGMDFVAVYEDEIQGSAVAVALVIIAFLAMTLSSLGFFRSMGPSLAIAVAVTLVAGLTQLVCPPRDFPEYWASGRLNASAGGVIRSS